MRSLSVKFLAAALAALLTAPVFAQRAGGTPGAGMLLFNKSVQEELKLTADQKASLKKLDAKRSEAIKAFQAGDRKKAQDLIQEANMEVAKVVDALDPKQKKRLEQIQLQTMGLFAFGLPKVRDTLKLTDKQKDEIQAISKTFQKDAQKAFEEMKGDFTKFPEVNKKVTTMRKEAQAKVAALLTPAQKKTWEEMTGKPFEMKMERFPGLGGPRPKGKPAAEK